MARSKRKQNIVELEAEIRVLRGQRNKDRVVLLGGLLIRWGFTFLMVRSIAATLALFAGKATAATFILSVLANVGISHWAAWLVAVVAVFYGQRQGRLRKSTVEAVAARIKELEGMIDPRRSSSDLTLSGETNPEDK